MSAYIVDTTEKMHGFIAKIVASSLKNPLLFVDLEGTNLSRHGSIAIMQVLVPPEQVIYLIDISTMKEQAFMTQHPGGEPTLKNILESESYPKVFFDVRNDSDALYSHYGIDLHCVIDIQLLEFASRPRRSGFLNGLGRCISYDCQLTGTERRRSDSIKQAGRKLFAPELGGSYDVFCRRPLASAIVDYCVQDVLLLPKLLVCYGGRMTTGLAQQVQEETSRRVKLSQSPAFNGKGQHMARGPSFTQKRLPPPSLPYPMSIVTPSTLARYCHLDAAILIENDAGPTMYHQRSRNLDTVAGVPDEPSTTLTESFIKRLDSMEINHQTAELPVDSTDTLESEDDARFDQSDDMMDDDVAAYFQPRDRSSFLSGGNSPKDFTACDKECGWCGNCEY